MNKHWSNRYIEWATSLPVIYAIPVTVWSIILPIAIVLTVPIYLLTYLLMWSFFN